MNSGKVRISGLNLRESTTEGKVIRVLRKSTPLEILGEETWLRVRTTDGKFYDFVGNDGRPDGIQLLGRGQLGHIAAPGDTTGHVILLLTTGVERVDLAAGISQWAIPASVFEAQGFGPFTLGDFALAPDGDTLYFTAATADWSGHALWRATLSSGASCILGRRGMTLVSRVRVSGGWAILLKNKIRILFLFSAELLDMQTEMLLGGPGSSEPLRDCSGFGGVLGTVENVCERAGPVAVQPCR